jgi:hypothetical protein
MHESPKQAAGRSWWRDVQATISVEIEKYGWRRIGPIVLILVAILVGAVLVAVFWPRPGVSIECTEPLREPLQAAYYFIQDQIIVTGPGSEVDNVVTEVPELELERLITCDVRVRRPGTLDAESLPFPPKVMRHLRMDLYGVAGTQTVKEAVQILNAQGQDRYVVAEPNYLTGLLGQSACSDPHTVVGSPHTVVGSPHTVVGSPHTVVGSPGAGAPPEVTAWQSEEQLFWEQWAWEHTGLGPALEPLLQGEEVAPTGEGIRVGVLDTLPFTQTSAYTISWMTPAWTLQAMTNTLPPLQPTIPVPESIRDHGLFVAGLIHGAAPDSEIHLIQVLDEHGCGSLFTLNEAVYHFIAQVEQDRRNLDGAVLNLSLGVLQPRLGEVTEVEATPMGTQITIDKVTQALAEDTIESLQAAVSLANQRGIVVVSAAGNDSYVGTQALSPHLPAGYPSVIGVAASNIRRERACFSNWGDVSAPGGDAGTNDGLRTDLQAANIQLDRWNCLPILDQCTGRCDHALISLGLTSGSGYYYWAGSSFSSPLVSGLAALVLDAGTTWCGWLAPDDVFAAIRCGGPTGDGVINAPATLSRCLP